METIIKSKKSLATLNNARAFEGASKLLSMSIADAVWPPRANQLIKKKKRSKKRQ